MSYLIRRPIAIKNDDDDYDHHVFGDGKFFILFLFHRFKIKQQPFYLHR